VVKVEKGRWEWVMKKRLKIVFFSNDKGVGRHRPPVLTNPLNSCTKLQIAATVQNKFLQVLTKP